MTDDQPIFDFHYARFSNLVSAAIFCWFATFSHFWDDESFFSQIFDILFRGGLLFIGLWCLRRGLQKKPAMTITQDSIFHSAKMHRPAPWSEIDSIGFKSFTGGEGADVFQFRFFLRNSEENRRPKPAPIEAILKLFWGEKSPPIKINANSFREDKENIYKALIAFGPELPYEAHEKLGPKRNKKPD